MITNEEDPSSTCSQTWVYDVFPSFRGEDTREGFTGNLYNTLHQRGVRTFIDDEKLKRGVRETSTKQGLLQLQKTLLGDTLGDKDFSLRDVKEGMERIQHGLLQKKVLIVLDDVDQLEQLQMLVEKDWFGTGSTIIVTTRDKHLLTAHDIDIKYEMKVLDDHEALELFCWSAFKNEIPDEGFEEISARAVQYSSNLPYWL
ncbi:NBS-containing resistance-like protein [Quillaja saponaria]|uniref:NBS-containing resistance-like protein n=1 Tax=Quillaja saponaria TaxID=32244 RepID=A0AAD7VH93_QUISA|nr:NBS-containing resistance-like protein [Quillaja saponaria]